MQSRRSAVWTESQFSVQSDSFLSNDGSLCSKAVSQRYTAPWRRSIATASHEQCCAGFSELPPASSWMRHSVQETRRNNCSAANLAAKRKILNTLLEYTWLCVSTLVRKGHDLKRLPLNAQRVATVLQAKNEPRSLCRQRHSESEAFSSIVFPKSIPIVRISIGRLLCTPLPPQGA